MEKWKKQKQNMETSLCGTCFCLRRKTRLLVQELEYILVGIDQKNDNPALCHAI